MKFENYESFKDFLEKLDISSKEIGISHNAIKGVYFEIEVENSYKLSLTAFIFNKIKKIDIQLNAMLILPSIYESIDEYESLSMHELNGDLKHNQSNCHILFEDNIQMFKYVKQ